MSLPEPVHLPDKKNYKIKNTYLDCYKLCDEYVEKLGHILPNLRDLHLDFHCGITSKGIDSVLKNCKFLRKMSLYTKEKFVVEEPPSHSHLMVNLEELELSGSGFDHEAFVATAKKCPHLLSLDLDNQTTLCPMNVTVEGLKQIVETIATLKCSTIAVVHAKQKHRLNLLEWMLSTNNFAFLKKIYVGFGNECFSEAQRDELLNHGCLILDSGKLHPF